MRRGFGLPQALMIILFIGGIVVLSVKYARINVRHYADSYTIEQARLYERSAMERALLEISDHNLSNGSCWDKDVFVSPENLFEANVTALEYYRADGLTCNNVLTTPIQTPESHGMVRLHVVVRDRGTARTTRRVRLESVSVQRP